MKCLVQFVKSNEQRSPPEIVAKIVCCENPFKEVYGTKIHEEFSKINDKKEVLYNPKPELIYENEQNNLKDNKIEIKENELILEIEPFPELEFINITRI